ncbi:MAG: hypothetical protein GX847_09965, partial [Clostridiales bacterium]|nr:hypothetical protein [Clostridiales bacterium]
MRELTFTGFLKSYVRSLSEAETNSLYKLAKEAADKNPRLRDPLLLYAKFTDNTNVLLRAAKKTALYSEYKNLANRYDKAGFEAALQDASSPLPEEYKKVWRSYLSKQTDCIMITIQKSLCAIRLSSSKRLKMFQITGSMLI